ncbi:chromosome segregation protein SMC [Gemelliphila palaticanis]|uniref:Chromosome partition protein Smc n=1 Tax=Gemelliphila palaticanis TaxID=81950 RepID=A0ABX2SZF8_9BACL|nr:chromosome segregation protein SMC [Gemella palaticanis]MBF0715835.1 chromosome segregation protein SMC [Gemella palaticanis]NYS47765.1 chromosome segregation protein SMC [Gemella palaticanis]
MKLKEVSVQGFKSFSNKFNFTLDDNLIGIIGPNGSGKSNIIDAIRWALGEQSAKNLRGSSMQDIIFSGTEEKKAKNFAEVSLTFYSEENDINQIVTRRLYKNGDSEYLLNGKKSKLKDISDIYLDLGINKESYSIITQGKVENIISSKPQDRRVIIEEAAGVLKYKNKRKETHLKLEKTNDNLTRLNDIFLEIETRNNILEEQKNKAEKYLEINKELQEKDIVIKVYNIKYISSILEDYKEEKYRLILSRDELNRKNNDFNLKISNLKNRLQEIDTIYNDLKNKELEKVKEKEKLQYELTLFEEKTKNADSLKDKFISDIKKIENKKESLISKINILKNNLKENIEKEKDISNRISNLESSINFNADDIDKQIDLLKEEYFDLINKESKLQNKLELLNDIKKNLDSDWNIINEDILEKKQELSIKKKLLENSKFKITDSEQKLFRIKSEILNLKTLNEKNKTRKLELLNNISKGNDLLLSFNNKKEFLENQNNSLNYYNIGVKEVLSNKNKIEGIHNTVGDILTINKEYIVALDTALSSSQQNIIVDNADVARVCVELLKNTGKGRATFLPLNNIKPRNIESRILTTLNNIEGFVGIASDLVTFDNKYYNIVNNLLGLTLIVDNLYTGNLISKKLDFKYKIVTLDGQVINSGGSITGGSIYKNSNSIIKNKIELEDLSINIDKIESKILTLKEELSTLDTEIINVNKELEDNNETLYKLEINLNEYNLEVKNLEETIKIISDALSREQDKLSSINSSYSQEEENVILSTLSSIKSKLSEINTSIDNLNIQKNNYKNDDVNIKNQLSQENINKYRLLDSTKSIKSKILEIEEEVEQLELDEKELKVGYNNLLNANNTFSVENNVRKIEDIEEYIYNIKEEEKTISNEKNNIYNSEKKLNQDISDINLELNNINNSLEKINFSFGKKEAQLDDNINYLLEKYNTTYERELYRLSKFSLEELSNFKNIVYKLQKELKSLGSVNINSIDEYQEVNSRYLFYKNEIEDLVSSREQLYSTISEIDKEVTERFLNTFNKISTNFDNIYKSLFGGGYAKISLDDDKDILNCGINIEVSPPGKKLQKLSLLSGGEKALTAMSLLFAILEIKKPPFVILDEVEAALDEDNVYKFSMFLKKYSKENQFIVITHRRGTMEVMDKIYGVTMKEKGVSYVLPLELKNILEENFLNE